MSCCSACGKHACACGCGALAGTPLPLTNRPGLDSLSYRVGTYADFRATMQAGLSDAALPALAGLRTRAADDPAMALLDAWAVGAEVLSFYTERIANEGYLRTATERRSVLELAQLVDYRLRPGVAASVYLAYTVEKDSPPVTIPAGARAQSIPAPGEQMQTFETAEPLDARHEWNALQPRLTQPQLITRGSLDTRGELDLKGMANNLKVNDWLVFEFADGSAPAARQIQQVSIDSQRQRTHVILQGDASASAMAGSVGGTAMAMSSVAAGASMAAPKSGFLALVDALRLPPTVQPANAVRLPRSAALALGKASDVRPQLLLNFERRIADTFYAAWSSTPTPASSAQVSHLHVLRVAAPLFGYNAPHMPPQPPIINVRRGGAAALNPGSDGDWPVDEQPNRLRLDSAYDGVLAGSYLLIQGPNDNEPIVARAASVRVHPHTAYGISGKTTDIMLTTPGGVDVWAAPNDMSTLREVQVHAHSERLTLAELLIGDTVGEPVQGEPARITTDTARQLTLDGAVDGLKAGSWVIVTGRRADVPGTDAVAAAELLMIQAVEQGVNAALPGDTVHSTLVFANKGLAYSYRRDSVAVHANVVRATHGETRKEVLGSGHAALPMQAFVLKQAPLTYVSAATVDGVQSTLGVRVNDMTWHETRNLAFAGAADRNFVTATDDSGKTSVVFGNGIHGARLPTGVENIIATYRNGIGTPGNVSAQQISLLATKPLGVKAVINPLRASGGADAETRDQARGNVPLAVLALDRLVSVPDYADFARTFGGVGKAAAVKLGNLVQVTIAGAADAPIDPSSDLYRNLQQALQRYGDPSLPLRLQVRELLALTMSAKVGLAPDHVWESVEAKVRAAVLDAFGFERRALGQSAYLSEVVACIQAVRGVAWVDVDVFDSMDEHALLSGFGVDGKDSDDAGQAVMSVQANTSDDSVVGQRLLDRVAVTANQLAYLSPNVPDTLLLQEATP